MSSIVTVIGWHNSGKTTLATGVVADLKKLGYRVAVIKSSSDCGIQFDSPGTDTYKHLRAGADGVLFVAPDQMVLQTCNSGHSLRELAQRYFPDVDIVIGEGFKSARKTAKIEVCRGIDQQLRKKVNGVIAVATDLEDIDGDNVFRLDRTMEIAAFIEKRFLLHRDERPAVTSVFVNGNKMTIRASDQKKLTSILQDFLAGLNYDKDIKEIELGIKTHE